MPGWLIDIYVLITSRVPPPWTAIAFAFAVLTTYTCLLPWQDKLTFFNMSAAQISVLFGVVAIAYKNVPHALSVGSDAQKAAQTLAPLLIVICTGVVFAPSLAWLQHAVSFLIGIYLIGFVLLTSEKYGSTEFKWFASGWEFGKRNAANWIIVRLCAAILGNEALARYGTTTDWIVGISLGAIALHYLMYWTIIATHPYER